MNAGERERGQRADYGDYRETGVRWFSRLPSHWRTERLKHIAFVEFSNVDKHKKEDELPVRLCNYTDVYYQTTITEGLELMEATATPSEIETYGLRAGDVIVTKDSESWDDIAVPAFVPTDLENVICGYHLAQLRPDSSAVNGKYLFWAFSSLGVKDQFSVASTGITRYGLGMQELRNGLIPLPPLDEQRAIAEFLDWQTGRINALIEKKRRLIELLEEKRTALITRAVTKGLDPDAPLKPSGVEWLGGIPEHWEVWPLRRFATAMCDGPFGSNLKSEHYSDDGVRVIRLQNVGPAHFDNRDRAYIPPEHYRTLTKHTAVPGDLIVAGLGDENHAPGRACVLPEGVPKAIVKADCYRVRLRDELLEPYVAHFLSSAAGQAGLTASTHGATRERINLGILGRFQVPVPPVGEQHAVLSFIEGDTKKIDDVVGTIKQATSKLQEYRTALISAAVTGKIDVRKM